MISDRLRGLVASSSGIREMFEAGAALAKLHGKENVFDFSLGNPSVATPASIKSAIDRILGAESPFRVHGYMNNAGFEDARELIAGSVNAEYGARFTADNIIMTCGAAGAVNIIMRSVLNDGDEVAIFSPYFAEYISYTAVNGGVPIIVEGCDSGFLPDLDEFERKLTARTKLVFVNSPNNPSGAVYPAATFEALAGILGAKQRQFGHPIYLISDEPYRKLVFEGEKPPFVPRYYKNTFIVYSLSKTLSIPGERIGYAAFPSEMDGFEEVKGALTVANRVLGFVNAPSLFQLVIAQCIDEQVDIGVYRRNRDLLYDSLRGMGYECGLPQGTFYMFPRSPIEDDAAFCNIAKGHNLLVVPGRSFGAPGYFRIAFCVDYDMIERSLPSFRRAYEDAAKTRGSA